MLRLPQHDQRTPSEKERDYRWSNRWLPRLCTRVIIHLLDYPEDPEHDDQEELLRRVMCALWAVRHLDDGPSCRFTVVYGALFFLEQLKPNISTLVADDDPLAVGHELFVTTLMISQKFYLNEQYSHKYYAERVAQRRITPSLLEKLEKTLLDNYLDVAGLNEDTLLEQHKDWSKHTVPLIRILNKANKEGKDYPLYWTRLVE